MSDLSRHLVATSPSPALGVSPDDFDNFYRREYAQQLRRAVLLVGSEADASDAVAHAFTNIFERWERLDDPGAYLNRSVLNACRDVGRRRVRILPMRTTADAPTADHPEAGVIDALMTLPYKQRAVIVLKHWAGLREREISAQLGIAQGSVGPTLSRAYKKLKPLLQEMPHGH